MFGSDILNERDFPDLGFCRQVGRNGEGCEVYSNLSERADYLNLHFSDEKVRGSYSKVIRDIRERECENCFATLYMRWQRHRE